MARWWAAPASRPTIFSPSSPPAALDRGSKRDLVAGTRDATMGCSLIVRHASHSSKATRSMLASPSCAVLAPFGLSLAEAGAAPLDAESVHQAQGRAGALEQAGVARQHGQGAGMGQGQSGGRQAAADPPLHRAGGAAAVPLQAASRWSSCRPRPKPTRRRADRGQTTTARTRLPIQQGGQEGGPGKPTRRSPPRPRKPKRRRQRPSPTPAAKAPGGACQGRHRPRQDGAQPPPTRPLQRAQAEAQGQGGRRL